MKFTDKESYSLPVIFAVSLHVAVIVGGVLVAGLTESAPEPPKRPPIVNATIVDISDTIIGKREADERRAAQAAAQAERDAQKKAQEQAQRKAERQAVEQQRREAEATRKKQEAVRKKAEAERQALIEKQKAAKEKARQQKIAQQKKAAEEKARKEQAQRKKREAEEKARKEAERKRQQELEKERAAEAERKRKAQEQAERRKRAEEAVQRAVAEEESRRQAAEAGKMVQSISGLINKRVTDAWIRPPSARNGMKTTLRINFLPNGEVSNVQVLKGSGDAIFDKRAMDAVYKVGRIEELSEIESYIFERNFRQVDLLFNPQDLRN
ncbi:cell envelope integrity protein TolA [Marinomonas atlantica]|uniref:cell envelope integrity protein TolA n=1 Tax=Marinomonas atlantica TaxID=1806668 RepID=UPI000830C98F|nr:cell envelope integrity protein TolA [Marinomonas atlantica]MCO4785945.1 cell envelope integrity protein TolA [Marinomonas atlantica]